MTRLFIERVAGLATVQDLGRPGRMHEGVPPGGALVPELLAHANAAVGNRADDAAIELFGRMTLAAGDEEIVVAVEDGTIVTVAPHRTLALSTPASLRVRYVTVRGGLLVPRVLGGRGTLLVARLGGFEGRALRAGDALQVGIPGRAHPPTGAPPPVDLRPGEPIRLIVGPDLVRFEAEATRLLLSEIFTLLPSSDRVGTRLGGPRLPRSDTDLGGSMPMVAGAIEVPASGPPIVLGPDHPTTGGYPVLAVVVRADLGRFVARPLGAAVRFAAA